MGYSLLDSWVSRDASSNANVEYSSWSTTEKEGKKNMITNKMSLFVTWTELDRANMRHLIAAIGDGPSEMLPGRVNSSARHPGHLKCLFRS